MEQNISPDYFLFADYFISCDKILILIKEIGECSDNVICEVGKYNKREQCINIEYLLDDKQILDSSGIKEKLKNIELSHIYKKISGIKKNNNEIEFKEYNFGFDTDNKNKKFIIDNKGETIIRNEKENEDIKLFKKNIGAKNNDENKL